MKFAKLGKMGWGWLLWLVLGMGLRAYNWGAYPFGFDQVQILKAAEAIRQGDLTLIGPRTGPAALFTGPLIYYLTAFVQLIFTPLTSLGLVSVGLAGATGWALYLLCKRYLSEARAKWLLPVWALSPFLISLDRVTWNPNLMVLAASLVLFPLLIDKRWGWREVLTVSVGVGLGYQAHFSGFLLLPLCLLGMGIHYRRSKWPMYWFLVPVLTWGLSLVPTIVFDLRHDFLNWRGLVSLITDPDKVSTYMLVGRLGHRLSVIAESMGKVWWYGNQTLWLKTAGAVGLVTGLWMVDKQSKHQARLMFGWLLLLALGLAMYRESTPEYYFLAGMPVWLVLWSEILERTLARWRPWLWMVLTVYVSLWVWQRYAPGKETGLNVGNQQAVAAEIGTLENTYSVSKIQFDMEPVEQIGIRYLVDKRSWTAEKNGNVLHVIYPLKETDFYTRKPARMVGLWMDSSNYLQSRAVAIYPFMLYVPEDLILREDVFPDLADTRQWQLMDVDGNHVATIVLLPKMGSGQIADSEKMMGETEFFDGWRTVTANGIHTYFRQFNTARIQMILVSKVAPNVRVIDLGSTEFVEYILKP